MNSREPNQKVTLFDESRKGKLLFHYTSLNSAVAILSTRSLLFGQICKLNDMNESWRPIQCTHWEDDTIELCDKELSSYVQISLTCEDNPEATNPKRGFDIATMWGHYAEGGNGVCIVLNKGRFLEAISKVPGCHHDYIHYKKDYDCAVLFETSNPEEEISRRITDIFFCKSDQWQYEQEYRIIKKSNGAVNCIDISGCIEGIIYARLGTLRDGSVYNTKGHWVLEKVCICNSIPLFGYIPRDLMGNRTLVQDEDGKAVWSTGEIIDLESGEWKIDKNAE